MFWRVWRARVTLVMIKNIARYRGARWRIKARAAQQSRCAAAPRVYESVSSPTRDRRPVARRRDPASSRATPACTLPRARVRFPEFPAAARAELLPSLRARPYLLTGRRVSARYRFALLRTEMAGGRPAKRPPKTAAASHARWPSRSGDATRPTTPRRAGACDQPSAARIDRSSAPLLASPCAAACPPACSRSMLASCTRAAAAHCSLPPSRPPFLRPPSLALFPPPFSTCRPAVARDVRACPFERRNSPAPEAA